MKTGRNDPCPCGSGRKYKKCCLASGAGKPDGVPGDLSPADLVRERCRAFGRKNFAFIYDTYHPDSYFRRQFPDRQAYLEHGAQTLSADYRIRQCRVLREEEEGEEARVLFYLETVYQGESVETFELSRFLVTAGGWRYHSSQKLARDEFPGPVEAIDFADFEKVRDKVFF